MMKIIYFVIGVMLLGILGCSKEKPEMFTRDRFIKFKFNREKGSNYYRIDYTFAFEADNVKEKEICVPVEFRGYTLTEDLYFAVSVDRNKTTLPEGSYKLETEQPFLTTSGQIDSMRVILLRDPLLKQETRVLRLQLVSNKNFQTYMPDSLYVEITVGDIFIQPEWWNEAVSKAYLGVYSKTKYEEFVKETGIRDFGMLDASGKRHYAILFKRALEKNPRNDEDGSVMSVTVTG